ncbi:OmpA family protein [Flavobacterium pectinovorum]|uniref:OmpA family protein n=1 Tax=Flavobacterium pectinovorum TaxID=29533 RepID=UPI001FAD535C|nr:OmpA family protein [Flavobacterium pectinovorum]MCI9843235.1 OmpA family protein [Flavobacterium pectinovorum]
MYSKQIQILKRSVSNYNINESSKYLDEFENSVSKAIDLSLEIIVKKIIDTTDSFKIDLFYKDAYKIRNTHENIIQNIPAVLTNDTSLDELSENFELNFSLDLNTITESIAQKTFIKLDSAERIFKMSIIVVICYFVEQKIDKAHIKSHFEDEVTEKEPEQDIQEKEIEETAKPGLSKKMVFAIAAILLVGLSLFFMTGSRQGTTATETTIDAEKQPQNIEFKDINKLGDYIDYMLPSDDIITIPEKGSEKAILDFILDNSNSLNGSGYWIVLDRIHFKDRAPSYFIDSEEQITNIALILSSFPKTKIEIAGYTDNLGNPKSNETLSLKRANSIKDALVKLKISEDRISTKGYGQEFPLFKNDNETNRKENRRIAVKIIK